jgi:hypothetical protein
MRDARVNVYVVTAALLALGLTAPARAQVEQVVVRVEEARCFS